MKKLTFLTVFILFFAFFASAQSAKAVTAMLETNEVTNGQAAYFAANALELVKENAAEQEAFDALKNAGFTCLSEDLSSPVKLDAYSELCMKAFNISGGLFYRLFKNSRYALRELKSLGIVPSDADPKQMINGRTALNMLSECYELVNGTSDLPEVTE